ncbi:hypothetical protein [Sphingobium cupriresistens]|uniref:Uncharacterized protein n=2 Tax=Sphingobium cupriresistens TaxID=1132417 RepID=A0A0J8ADT4_9SPHN|nr:hypothetical protein [Sphingobium cupriresistens]KMS53215.1 hypothetical protein V473_19755 [Sphingobium cupriresistens LL01]RYM13879.1 hypothetical protein EWH12_04225 [Sphingobium cupriresistens]
MYETGSKEESVTHVTTTEARGGSRTRATRNILTISLLLIVIILAVALGFGFFETGQSGADNVNTENAAQQSAGPSPGG